MKSFYSLFLLTGMFFCTITFAQPIPSEEALQKQIKKYEEIVRDNPKDIEYWHKLADLYRTAERWEDAISADSKAISLFSTYAIAYYGRGKAYFGKKDYKQAIAEFSKALQLWEGDKGIDQYLTLRQPTQEYIESYRTRGVAYTNEKNYEKAIPDFTASIKLDKNNPQWYYERGYVYEKANMKNEAVKDYFYAGKVYLDYYSKSDTEKCIKALKKLSADKEAKELEQLLDDKQKPKSDFEE